MKKLFLNFVLFCTSVSFSQTTLLPEYNDFISGILQHNPLAKRANNEKKYAELQLRSSRGNYDPIVSGNYDQKQFNGLNYFTTLSSEIKQPIFTNQYLKFGYDYGIGPFINPDLYTTPQGLPYLGLEVGVLQGLVIDKRRADVLKSKAYLNYYSAEQQIQLNNLLFESSQLYFEWLFSAKQISLNNYFMTAARKRLEGIEQLAIVGERAIVDTIEAAIFYQTRLLDLQTALMDNQKSSNDLSSYIWQNGNPSLLNNNYKAIDSLETYYNKAKVALAENLNLANAQNPILSKYNALQNVLNVDVRLKREMIKPILNVKYNFLSNSTSAINPVFTNNNYKWGLNMSFPLFLRNSTNDYKMANVISQNNSLELTNKTNELNFKINALQQNISILAQQLLNSERSVNYSKILLEAEKLKFDNGESSLFMLNTRENKLLETELKLAEYKLKFIKTTLNIIYLNGNLNYKL
ncbi:MAG: TolC family protein [Bacteroidota bacterium]|nr:TolC family protein [Bacteroidota bacterium]MDP3145540.1 TolC family protein [Bacteroidota bacterium]MDP3557991.1 TolC family protein [Bacteroidota bacterium]